MTILNKPGSALLSRRCAATCHILHSQGTAAAEATSGGIIVLRWGNSKAALLHLQDLSTVFNKLLWQGKSESQLQVSYAVGY